MISLRKHIDDFRMDSALANEPAIAGTGVPEHLVSEFRAIILAIGESAGRAVPNLGIELDRKITEIQAALIQPVTADLLTTSNRQARSELSTWADRALSHHQAIERELREMVSAVSTAAESVNRHDEKYAAEIGRLTGSLVRTADENDVAKVRHSIVETARALKECVARMVEDSKASVHDLTAQVNQYRARLAEAERASRTDPLTRLANRRAFEQHLEARVADCRPFCLIMIDLDDFKAVNDRFGHIAGDDLLRQFAEDLESQFTSAEMVGRLGGDEFIVVVSGGASDALRGIERIRRWAFGEYKINTGIRQVKTRLNASIGFAAWDGKESGLALLSRADKDAYRAKQPSGRVRMSGS